MFFFQRFSIFQVRPGSENKNFISEHPVVDYGTISGAHHQNYDPLPSYILVRHNIFLSLSTCWRRYIVPEEFVLV